MSGFILCAFCLSSFPPGLDVKVCCFCRFYPCECKSVYCSNYHSCYCTPDVTLNANQDAGQAATTDTNEVFTSVDGSECASSSECPLSGGAIQLNDENVRSRPPLDFDHGMS